MKANRGGTGDVPFSASRRIMPHVVLYVVGGTVDAMRNAAVRNFPLVNRRKGESKATHLKRVIQLVDEARAAGGTHLLVPREHADWLGDHPLLAKYFAEQHELAEASAETGIVFTLRSRIDANDGVDLLGLDLQTHPAEVVIERGAASAAYDIVIFSIISWNFRFQRPQQLATQFGQAGHRVFYVDVSFHDEGSGPVLSSLAERIYGLRLPWREPLSVYVQDLPAQAVNDFLAALSQLRQRANIENAVCLVQLPFWAPLAWAARARWGWRMIYDCMDELGGFEGMGAAMLDVEDQLIAESDLVLATSQFLHEKVAPRAQKSLLLPNATDFEHFNRPQSAHPLADTSHPIVGYYGAISHWFDVDMVKKAARLRPEWQFVLIGHTHGADVSRLEQLPNVHLLGEVAYRDLPAYLADFDVACIPFLRMPLTEATNPVKFYEYLSAGKPIVAVPLPELEPYAGYFYPAENAEEFVIAVETALDEDSPENAQRRMALARENTWAARFATLSSAVDQLYGRVAIIIVSYNNRSYLRQCLESIWTKTPYPSFEVIVVDNGSRPKVVEYLRAVEKVEPRLRVIFNGENLGFARANNIGIEAAGACRYVVLLNNDTVVTRGWLSRLVHYLDDPSIGIVGPVSNWTANEARIHVDYEDLDQMDTFAARYTRAHENETFEIPMLAMYCVGMRRALLDEVGLLDERFKIGMFEDDDFAMRVRRADYRVICAKDVFVHHWGRASFGRMDREAYKRLFAKNRRKYEKKWGVPWQRHQSR